MITVEYWSMEMTLSTERQSTAVPLECKRDAIRSAISRVEPLAVAYATKTDIVDSFLKFVIFLKEWPFDDDRQLIWICFEKELQ
jgi:hypothetical protein